MTLDKMSLNDMEEAFGVLENEDLFEILESLYLERDEDEVKRVVLLSNPGIDLKEISDNITKINKIRRNVYDYLEYHDIF